MATIDLKKLDEFTGTERWYKHWAGHLFFTDGVHYLRENGASWLVDAIAGAQHDERLKSGPDKDRLRDFQLWTLQSSGSTALLTCQADMGEPPVITQEYTYTDFPPGEVKLYVERDDGRVVLLLADEH